MREELFPEVTNNILASIVSSLVILVSLFFLSNSMTQPADPIMMYIVTTLAISYLMLNTVKFDKIKSALGFSTPYPGFNILIFLAGIGFAAILFSGLTKPLMIASMGNVQGMSIARPLYIPQLAEPYSVIYSFGIVGNNLFWGVVGVVETIMVILLFKNISGWLYSKGLRKGISLAVGFNAAGGIFGIYHVFAWPELTIFSIIMAMIFNVVFFSSYFIADLIGLLAQEKAIEFTAVLSSGAVGAHWAWDKFVVDGSPLSLEGTFALGIILIALSYFSMKIIKGRF